MTAPSTRQLFSPLDAGTEAALRASIRRFGVLVPIVVDQHGKVIDGHHRQRLAAELHVKCPREIQRVDDESHAHALAVTLNTDRRHLTAEQRRDVVVHLDSKRTPDGQKQHSTRAIAHALGVDQKTVVNDLVGEERSSPERVVGRDGKSYPATKATVVVKPINGDPRVNRGLRRPIDVPQVASGLRMSAELLTASDAKFAPLTAADQARAISDITAVIRALTHLRRSMKGSN